MRHEEWIEHMLLDPDVSDGRALLTRGAFERACEIVDDDARTGYRHRIAYGRTVLAAWCLGVCAFMGGCFLFPEWHLKSEGPTGFLPDEAWLGRHFAFSPPVKQAVHARRALKGEQGSFGGPVPYLWGAATLASSVGLVCCVVACFHVAGIREAARIEMVGAARDGLGVTRRRFAL